VDVAEVVEERAIFAQGVHDGTRLGAEGVDVLALLLPNLLGLPVRMEALE
jgi:hypothetical protein